MDKEPLHEEEVDKDGQESVFLPIPGAPNQTHKFGPAPTPQENPPDGPVPRRHRQEKSASPDSGDGRPAAVPGDQERHKA